MKASIVIPSYNMSQHLRWSLRFLAAQRLGAGDALQVIVVDDGSSDDTSSTVAELSDTMDIVRVFRPRDAHSSRSRARNLGLSKADGETVTFLDAGVIVGPTFVASVLARARISPSVILHRCLGLFARSRPSEWDTLSPSALEGLVARLCESEPWRDKREAFFASVNDDLDQLASPWALGFSCSLTVPRVAALAVGGFDEEFLGWGAEDIDFCYRLHATGTRFRGDRAAVCLHLPHGGDDSELKVRQHATNARAMLRKRPSLEGELFVLLGSLGCSLFARRLAGLHFELMLPPYAPEVLQATRARLGDGGLLVVGGNPELSEALNWSGALVASQRELPCWLNAARGGATVARSLGTFTLFGDEEFPHALLTDAIRLFPESMQVAILEEIARVSRRLALIVTLDDTTPARAFRSSCRDHDGWGWASVGALERVCRSVGLECRQESVGGGAALLWLSRVEGDGRHGS